MKYTHTTDHGTQRDNLLNKSKIYRKFDSKSDVNNMQEITHWQEWLRMIKRVFLAGR